jgi:hypothetical protein
MSDNTQLNEAAAPLGDIIATDDIGGVKHQRVKVQVGADGTAQDVHDGRPMPVKAGMTMPQTTAATAAVLAAGGSADLDSAQISSGLTGKLVALLMTASVSLKGELKTVLNGVESAVLLTFFSRAGESVPLLMPNKDFFTQMEDATAGLDGFRVTVTNLDTSQAADVYVTHFYDEE